MEISTCLSNVSLFPSVDASALESNEEIEIAYPITCGDSKAILLWKKFVCPGINVKCVKVNSMVKVTLPALFSLFCVAGFLTGAFFSFEKMSRFLLDMHRSIWYT